MPTALQLQPRSASTRCVLCHDSLERVAVTCPDCGTLVHEECQLDRCPTLGCVSENPWEWVDLPGEPWVERSPWRQPLILLNVILLGLIVFGVTAEWALEACVIASSSPWGKTFSDPERHPSLLDPAPPCYCAGHSSALLPSMGRRGPCTSTRRRLRFKVEAHTLKTRACGCDVGTAWFLLQGSAREIYEDQEWAGLSEFSGDAWVQEIRESRGCLIYGYDIDLRESVETPAGSFLCTYRHTWSGEGEGRIDVETWTAPGISVPVVTQITWRTPGAPGGFPNVRRSVLQRIDPPTSAK